jgi:hypothetical protein
VHRGIAQYEAGVGPCAEWQAIALLDMGLARSHNFTRTVLPGASFDMNGRAAAGCEWESVTPSAACKLPHHSTWCAVVRARNMHGLWGPRVRSDGVRVCTQGPTIGTVSDGTSPLYGQEMDYVYAVAPVGANADLEWSGFTDSCAPIERYEVTLQAPADEAAWKGRHRRHKSIAEDDHSWQPDRGEGSVDDAVWNPVGTEIVLTQVSSTFTSLQLDVPAEGRYRARVCALNVIRQRSCAYSDGFVRDDSPPSDPTICIAVGTGSTSNAGSRDDCAMGARWLPTQDQVALTWRGCNDPESGAFAYRWSISDAATPSAYQNMRAEEDVGRRRKVHLSQAVLRSGLQVTVWLRCFNGAGRSSTAVTLGPLGFDDTPPEIGDGTLALLEATSGTELHEHGGEAYSSDGVVRIRIAAGDISEPGSGLHSLTLRVRAVGGVDSDSKNVYVLTHSVSPSDFSSTTFVDFSVAASAEPHAHHEASIEATNNAGLSSAWRSDAFLYDAQPPTLGRVGACDDADEPITHQAATDTMRLCWGGVLPPRSGIVRHTVTLTWPPQCPGCAAGHVLHAHECSAAAPCPTGVLSGLSLPCGATVTVTSHAWSAALVMGEALTATVGIDCTAPTVGSLSFGTGSDDGAWCAPAGGQLQAEYSMAYHKGGSGTHMCHDSCHDPQECYAMLCRRSGASKSWRACWASTPSTSRRSTPTSPSG